MKLRDLMQPYDGHCNSYSTYLLLNVSPQQVLNMLNRLDIDGAGNGYILDDRHFCFEIEKSEVNLIYIFTKELNTIGYADTAWDEVYTLVAKNGEDYDGFTARWTDGTPYNREGESNGDKGLWDAFITYVDNENGAEFYSGAGVVEKDIVDMYQRVIDAHRFNMT